jgi:cytoskeletal protein RodZ
VRSGTIPNEPANSSRRRRHSAPYTRIAPGTRAARDAQTFGKELANRLSTMTIGRELTDARERLGLSRDHISVATKIQVGKVAALEEHAFDRLPSGIYLDGIVAAYAREVRLDGEALVRRLRAQLAPPPPETLEQIATARQSSRPPAFELPFNLAHGMFAFVSVVVMLAILGVAVRVFPRQRANEPRTIASARPESATSVVALEIPIRYGFRSETGTTGIERADASVPMPFSVAPLPTVERKLKSHPVAQPEPIREPRVLSAIAEQAQTPVERRALPSRAVTGPMAVIAASNLAGRWTLETQIESSSVRTFEGLRLGYRLELRQNGSRIEGTGQKISENGVLLSGQRQTPIAVLGTIDGGRLRLTFGEQGARRSSTGTFDLVLEDAGVLRGSFASDAARSAGVVEARRL